MRQMSPAFDVFDVPVTGIVRIEASAGERLRIAALLHDLAQRGLEIRSEYRLVI